MDKPNLFSNEIYGLMDYLDPEKREVSKASKYNFTRMNEDEKNIYYYLNGRFGQRQLETILSRSTGS